MFCCLAIFAAFFPRVADVLIWIARPQMFLQAFNNRYIWPILGIIFLPFTTLMYVILWRPGIGLTGWDWLWLILAVMLDVMHWGQMGYNNRRGVPGYTYPSSSTPPPPSAPSGTSGSSMSSTSSDTGAPGGTGSA